MEGFVNPERPTVVELAGSESRLPGGASRKGRWIDKAPLEVSLLLRRRDPPEGRTPMVGLGLEPFGARQYLTPSEFSSRHGPRTADLERVRQFADEMGLTVSETAPVRRTVKLRGPPADIERAFGVELWEYELPTGRFRSYEGPIRIPARLERTIVGVFGLDTRPILRPHFRRNNDPAAQGLAIPNVATAYAFPTNSTGADVTIGLLEFGGGYSLTDLEQFWRGLGRPSVTVQTIGVDGATNAPTGDPNGPDAEVELDIEVASAIAPKAKVVVYFAPNTEQGFVDALTTAVHDASNAPSVVSISWGGPEQSWTPQARNALEEAAQDAALQGISIIAASGDQGASDGEPGGMLAVDFPASSPYVIGCGGTRLDLAGTSILSEVVWNDLSEDEGATGGGVSEEFGLPSYQAGYPVPSSPAGTPGRGVPDVAGNADPLTGYAVFVDGAPAVIGGTSAVAPLWAGLIALFTQLLGKSLGYANPLFYAANEEATFRQITSGNNDGYSAGPRWNACTGLGSPNGRKLLAALRQ